MMTGKIWLRVPETICVELAGERPDGVAAKDVALEIIRVLGADGANYQTLEFRGSLDQFALEERLVFCNLAVEADAKAAIWPFDEATAAYLPDRTARARQPVMADDGAPYARTLTIDLATLTPRVSIPHSPNDVRDLITLAGTPIHMVFIGTCTGGRVSDVHDALAVIDRAGGRLAPTTQLVFTPASEEVRARLEDDGSLDTLRTLGATITTAGCGACCGTSGVIPGDGMNVLSTANRNFKARMGNATARIYLASPAACAAAAVTGLITDPAAIGA
jgi:3-isopropylmalate/(R)-2-methylmalate dehydratase large subunit